MNQIIVCFFVGFLISNDGSSIFKEKVFKFRYISNAIPAGAHRKQTGVKHAVASKSTSARQMKRNGDKNF